MRMRRGVSTPVVVGAIIVIVIIIVGAFVLFSSSSGSGKTTTSTSSTSSGISTTTSGASSSSVTSGSTSAAGSISASSASNSSADAALYQAALKEGGTVVVYGSPTAQQFANITAAFRAAYPGMSVQYTSIQPPQAVPRIESELSTQNYSADIAFQAATTVYPLEQKGYAMPYVSPYASSFPKQVLDPLNESTPIIQLALGWLYNTQMIQPANVPTTMAAVANPQFKNEIVMNDPTTGTAFTQYWASLAGYLGNSTVYNFLHALKNVTSPTIVATTTSCANTVASGADAICLGGYMQEAAPDIQDGAPLKFLNITGLPIMITPSNSMIIKNAQHPAGAELLTDFMASPAGQVAWGNIDVRTPVTPNVAAKWSFDSELKNFYPGAGPQIYFPTPQVASQASAWGSTFAFLKS
jgi:ABC-type Fe3+ transport system substrate-binding protein